MSGDIVSNDHDLGSLEISLERDVFLRGLVRHLAGTLEDVVGLDEAAGYVSLVGQAMGEEIQGLYKEALGVDELSTGEAAEVMVDLKRRIRGDFSVESIDEDRIVLTNRACPFGEKVRGRESMCMMTSNVFGYIAADSAGYAKVVLEDTIARGSPGCRVVVHMRPTPDAEEAEGREYYRAAPATGEPSATGDRGE